MVKVAVGSTNLIKINAVRNVFSKYFQCVEVFGKNVDSNVSEQPLGYQEILEGARNRAKKALEGENFGVGIEAGLIDFANRTFDVQICVIIKNDGKESIGIGPGFEIPKHIAENAKMRVELSKLMEKLTGIKDIGKNVGAIGYLTKSVMERTELTEIAVLMALVPIINKELYLGMHF